MRVVRPRSLGLFAATLLCIVMTALQSTPATGEEYYKFHRLWPTLSQPSFFRTPLGIAVDGDGFVYVVDWTGIWKFTADGQSVDKWGTWGLGDGEFYRPHDIAVDGYGFVYVADTKNHRIQKFSPDGLFVLKWGKEVDGVPVAGDKDGEFDEPGGIAVDGDGFVYVADTENDRIQKFSPDGQFVLKWGAEGSEDGELKIPLGIAVDGDGFVYVADAGNSRIQKFTPDGRFVAKWGSKGTGGEEFLPVGIVIDRDGFVYVVEVFWSDRIQRFTANGQFVDTWGSGGSGDGQFYAAKGIGVDEDGFVYVADAGNDRIQKFSPDGQFVQKWGSGGGGGWGVSTARGHRGGWRWLRLCGRTL